MNYKIDPIYTSGIVYYQLMNKTPSVDEKKL